MAKLCLGTVQFGMKYGVNNRLGQPSLEDSFTMLDTALNRGIQVIDTAKAYGNAEEILGKYIRKNQKGKQFRIISKLRPNVLQEGEQNVQGVIRKELQSSLECMGVEQLDGYLLHTPQYIYHNEVMESLIRIKEEGLVGKIGVSIYNIEEGLAAIRTGIVDYIQLPYSILDQRGTQTGFIEEAKKAGITIFTRSAFLQGLFMMGQEEIPMHLKKAIPHLHVFEELLQKYQVNKVDALIHFVTEEQGVDYLVFGVDTKEQLEQDIQSYHGKELPTELKKEIKEKLIEIDESIIFPSLWSNGKKAE